MTTATVLLNLALGAGTSGLVAAGMTVVPNMDRLRFHRRTLFAGASGRRRERLAADLQPQLARHS